MKERYKLIPEVFLMLIKDGKILLSRRKNTGWNDGNYGLPAGHGEDRETAKEGTAREALEEIGITIGLKDLEHVVTQHRWSDDPGNPHARVGFYFVPQKWQGEPRNMEPDKCDHLQFFPLDNLPPNVIDHVQSVIASYRKGEHYDEFGWESRI